MLMLAVAAAVYAQTTVKERVTDRQGEPVILSHVLDCANEICFEDNTSDFEKTVRKAKTGQNVVAVFNIVELKSI